MSSCSVGAAAPPAAMELASAVPDQLRQHESVVVLGVAGGVHDRQRSLTRAAAQPLDLLAVCGELVAVARAELREALGHVVKPLAQLVAGRQLARPFVQLGAFAGDAARPDVVDQHPVAVAGVRVLVGALDAHVDRHGYAPGYVTTRPHRLLVAQMPRRRHSSWTIWEWSTNRLTSGP